jgi:hypothetical protein
VRVNEAGQLGSSDNRLRMSREQNDPRAQVWNGSPGIGAPEPEYSRPKGHFHIRLRHVRQIRPSAQCPLPKDIGMR